MTYYKRIDGGLARPPWVYFIQCDKFVKIGTTLADPRLRVQAIRVLCPFPANLMAVIEGGRKQEHEWHLRYEDELERGEWFRLSPRLRNAIYDLRPTTVDFPDRIKPMLSKAKQRARRRELLDANGVPVTRSPTFRHTEKIKKAQLAI